MSTEKDDNRSHEHVIEIDAPPQDVWRAMTDAEELTRWFPLAASIEPGEGGSLTYSWGPGVEGACQIQAWEPSRHLRTTWFEHPEEADDEARRQLVVDWHLEGRGGKTVLRLVHSGFGSGEAWDGEFDATNRGWDYELRSLRHYLHHHAGRPRHAFWLRQPTRLPVDEVWRRLTSPGALVAAGSLDGLGAGERCQATLVGGDELHGEVILSRPPTDFATTVDGLNQALFRLGYESFGSHPEATLWLSTWGVPEGRVQELEGRWKGALEEALQGG